MLSQTSLSLEGSSSSRDALAGAVEAGRHCEPQELWHEGLLCAMELLLQLLDGGTLQILGTVDV